MNLSVEITQTIVSLIAGGSLTAFVVAMLTLRQRRGIMGAQAHDQNATADARIMGAAASLVEQAGTQVPALMERITRLEASNERILDEQAAERAELVAWRQWGAAVTAWSSQAVEVIRALGGTIPDPPSAPSERRAPVPGPTI